ncbi:MAG: right-handed parallel beta-helix repeat-containing protein [Candidatus Omnitrophica bacterium]|nr:right-handed parallel beta-helix repeat-containing protein [Candidatus Omnitrophota bacterium]
MTHEKNRISHTCFKASHRLLLGAILLLLFLIPGSGRSQAGNFPTPLDFGAVGDGVVDDSAAIQSAIDASGTIYLADRVYRIAVGLNLPGGSNLIGPGSLLVDFDTGDSTEMNSALRLNGDNIRIENFILEKTFIDGSQGMGISAHGSQNLTLDSVEISGYSARPGILFQDCTRFQITDCWVHDFLLDTTTELSGDAPAGIFILDSTDGVLSKTESTALKSDRTGAELAVTPLRISPCKPVPGWRLSETIFKPAAWGSISPPPRTAWFLPM